jgi:hypothetical protein
MKSFLCGLAVLPFLAATAMAAPAQPLSDNQMDSVTAGFDLRITEITNTAVTAISLYEGPIPNVPGYGTFIYVYSPSLSVLGGFRGYPSPT